jgi:2-succinyl-6-hydroxy-2,4-cyclohexadiene-1-carboxylate synthase
MKYPDRFIGLVLESTTAGMDDRPHRQQRLVADRKIATKLRQSEMQAFLNDWYQQPLFKYLKSEMVAAIISKKMVNKPNDLAEVVVRLSQGIQPPLWTKLCQWTKPTLILAGEIDKKYCELAKRMSSLISSSKLRIIPDAGHIIHLENNKDFVSALNSFLSYIFCRKQM